MTNLELRDDIAKELFMHGLKIKGGTIDDSEIARIAFNSADAFMNEKLKRDNNRMQSQGAKDREFIGNQ